MNQPAIQCYEFDEFHLDATKRLLLRKGKVVPLKAKDFDLLLALIERGGQTVSKEELLKQVWQDAFVEEGNLSVHIFALRRALGETPEDHRYIVTVPGRGYSFVAAVRNSSAEIARAQTPNAAISFTPAIPSPQWEPVGGAVSLDSRFYIERETDLAFRASVAHQDSIVLIKGARQVGKTSLLARSLQQAREAGARVAWTDFQMLNESHLASAESLLLMLAQSIADQLDLPVLPKQIWDEDLGPSLNFTRYIRREVLSQGQEQMVWGLDEVDRLFGRPFGSEIFGLFRSWHNARALDPAGPWRQLTLAMAYATEAHLFITDVHQSPFNVGTRLLLEDFTIDQVAELNRRYATPLQTEAELARYFALVGGHPYLVRRGLHEMATKNFRLAELKARATLDEGPFGDHLRRLLFSVTQDQNLCNVLTELLQGNPYPASENFYRLRSAGVIVGDAPTEARLRCQLYATYLKEHLQCST